MLEDHLVCSFDIEVENLFYILLIPSTNPLNKLGKLRQLFEEKIENSIRVVELLKDL